MACVTKNCVAVRRFSMKLCPKLGYRDIPWLIYCHVPNKYTLWLFNIAMGNGPFIDGSPIKMVIFHGYVKQPDGSCQSSMISSGPVGFSHLYDLDASFSATDHPCYGLPGGKKSLGIYVVASDPIGCGCKEFFRAFAWSPPQVLQCFFLSFW